MAEKWLYSGNEPERQLVVYIRAERHIQHGDPLTYHVAIVEDESTIRENYSDILKRQGYDVTGFANRPAAQAAFDVRLPDLAIIDIGLGQEIDGGFVLCQWLRARSSTLPIIFLSARDSDFDVVSGLRMGADDYLTKDVSLHHLIARVAALFRRVEAMQQPHQEEDTLHRGKLHIDLKRVSTTWADKRVDLTLTEFWMVHSLARHVGHVKSREQLMNDSQMVVDDTTITSHIKRIRQKFIAVDPEFDAIETVYGMGYRWQSHVS